MTAALRLEAADILRILPHRHPFALLDRAEVVDLGTSAVGIKNISIADPVFAGHFPGNPIYPGVQLIETAAQLCGVILATVEGSAPSTGYLASIKRFKFMGLVRPGDQLRISAEKKLVFGALSEFTVDLRVDGTSVAAGSLAIALPHGAG